MKRTTITKREVLSLCGISATTLWRYISAAGFPAPIGNDGSRSLWEKSAVQSWLVAHRSLNAIRGPKLVSERTHQARRLNSYLHRCHLANRGIKSFPPEVEYRRAVKAIVDPNYSGMDRDYWLWKWYELVFWDANSGPQIPGAQSIICELALGGEPCMFIKLEDGREFIHLHTRGLVLLYADGAEVALQ